MRIILLITVCNQNPKRIQSQINYLNSVSLPDGISPLFVFGKGGNPTGIPFDVLVVKSEEEYNQLYLKLFNAYKLIDEKFDYDFICKVDDDTKLNIERLNENWLKGSDLIGRIYSGGAECSITFNLEFYGIQKKINLSPPFFTEVPFKFATGDCYFLSKKAVKQILKSENILDECSGLKACEDRLFGYMLHETGMIINDINLKGGDIDTHRLQVTENYFSIHPINENIFDSLVGKSVEEQLSIVCSNATLNTVRRNAYLKDLEHRLISVVNEFSNSKKSIGLG